MNVKGLLGLIAGFLVISIGAGWSGTAVAEEIRIFDPPDRPHRFKQCYSLSDPYHPGPAAHFGEDVCVEYEAVNCGLAEVKHNDDGTDDVDWHIWQAGTAQIYAASDDELLYDGPFSIEEVGRDLGGDADCISSEPSAQGGLRVWTGACANIFDNLDLLLYRWKIEGDQSYLYEATIGHPGTWCSFDREGRKYGPGCS